MEPCRIVPLDEEAALGWRRIRSIGSGLGRLSKLPFADVLLEGHQKSRIESAPLASRGLAVSITYCSGAVIGRSTV